MRWLDVTSKEIRLITLITIRNLTYIIVTEKFIHFLGKGLVIIHLKLFRFFFHPTLSWQRQILTYMVHYCDSCHGNGILGMENPWCHDSAVTIIMGFHTTEYITVTYRHGNDLKNSHPNILKNGTQEFSFLMRLLHIHPF